MRSISLLSCLVASFAFADSSPESRARATPLEREHDCHPGQVRQNNRGAGGMHQLSRAPAPHKRAELAQANARRL